MSADRDAGQVRLTSEERAELRCHCGTHEPMSGRLRAVPLDVVLHHQTFCPVPAVERILAARQSDPDATERVEWGVRGEDGDYCWPDEGSARSSIRRIGGTVVRRTVTTSAWEEA